MSTPTYDDVRAGTGTPPSGSPRYPLGWLRALAALVVVTFHAYQHHRGPDGAAGGWPLGGLWHRLMLGSDAFVDMFFVLSGLVLWLPVARSAVAGDTSRSGRMLLLKRVARLLPLYYAVVLLVWALSNPVFPGEHWGDLLLHLTFLHVYSDQYVFWTDGPAWSLAVEMHFYLLMALSVPVLNAAVRRLGSRTARTVAAAALPTLLVVVGLAYLTWAIVVSPQDQDNWSIWFSPLSRAADFGLGTGLAVLVAVGVRAGGRVRSGLAVLGVGSLLALVLTRDTSTTTGEWWHPAFSLTIAMGLAAVVLTDGPWPAWMHGRTLAWLGGLGYGIYLIHEPVMRVLDGFGLLPGPRPGAWFLLTAVLVAVPTVLLAWLSSRTVETVGVRMLGTLDSDGASRDYYSHLGEDGSGSHRAGAAASASRGQHQR
ncbi:hypothetical protein GCM10011519_21520 [Marmoricola endophyticus]|uniref:Acyltransferase 3 domain-containing protein n=1 Tax=Marmoricola endophyticus TaxID=2040280 RepID=A0A917BJV9_9ACTN|nr:acyltransferase [Marmoricola endophyticus]GGF47173.1 hypothetical protein GCM10011519_21520 [Marmoricola endophyticus]